MWKIESALRRAFSADCPILRFLAACSIRYCNWAKALYDSQRARGKGHHAAVRAVAFKWIRIIFACWKHRTPYE